MGSHSSVTCHPTQVNTPHRKLTPARQAGTRDPRGMVGRVDLGGWGYVPRGFTCQQTVTHPRSNRARCRATTLIETDVLTTTSCRHPPSTNKSNDVYSCPTVFYINFIHNSHSVPCWYSDTDKGDKLDTYQSVPMDGPVESHYPVLTNYLRLLTKTTTN